MLTGQRNRGRRAVGAAVLRCHVDAEHHRDSAQNKGAPKGGISEHVAPYQGTDTAERPRKQLLGIA
jgi:hypothetical protein